VETYLQRCRTRSRAPASTWSSRRWSAALQRRRLSPRALLLVSLRAQAQPVRPDHPRPRREV